MIGKVKFKIFKYPSRLHDITSLKMAEVLIKEWKIKYSDIIKTEPYKIILTIKSKV